MKRKSKKDLKNLFNSGMKKKFISVVSSVMAIFVVVSIVGASSTIGLNISTDGNLTVTGNSTVTGDATVTGATTQTGAFTAAAAVTANGDVNLGNASTDALYVTASSTFLSAAHHASLLSASSTVLLQSGFTSYGALTVTSTATSTMGGTYEFSKTGATTTVQIGRNLNGSGAGGCIALQDNNSGAFLYVFAQVDVSARLVLATSTNSRDCY